MLNFKKLKEKVNFTKKIKNDTEIDESIIDTIDKKNKLEETDNKLEKEIFDQNQEIKNENISLENNNFEEFSKIEKDENVVEDKTIDNNNILEDLEVNADVSIDNLKDNIENDIDIKNNDKDDLLEVVEESKNEDNVQTLNYDVIENIDNNENNNENDINDEKNKDISDQEIDEQKTENKESSEDNDNKEKEENNKQESVSNTENNKIDKEIVSNNLKEEKEKKWFFNKIKNIFNKKEKNANIRKIKEEEITKNIKDVDYLENMKYNLLGLYGLIAFIFLLVVAFNIYYFLTKNFVQYKKIVDSNKILKEKKLYLKKLQTNYNWLKNLLENNDLKIIWKDYFDENIIEHLEKLIKIVNQDMDEDLRLITKIAKTEKELTVNVYNIKHYDAIKYILLKLRQIQKYYLVDNVNINLNDVTKTFNLTLKLKYIWQLF